MWSLTPAGRKKKLTAEEAQAIAKKWAQHFSSRKKKAPQPEPVQPEPESDSDLLSVIQSLSPTGFEHLCRRLLLEYGFNKVVVTQRTRDGGIDGEGILQINPFISSVVVFQCKKYRRTVSSEEVTRLRGAAGGRADKAILITTGTFSAPAKAEAIRISPHIELIDGEQLVHCNA